MTDIWQAGEKRTCSMHPNCSYTKEEYRAHLRDYHLNVDKK